MHYIFSRNLNSVKRYSRGVTIKTTDVEHIIGISPHEVLDICEYIVRSHPKVKAYLLNVSWAPNHSEECSVDEQGHTTYPVWDCRVYLYYIITSEPERKSKVCIDWSVDLDNRKVSKDDIAQLVHEAFDEVTVRSRTQSTTPERAKEHLDYSLPQSSLYDDAKNWDALGDFYLK